MKLNHDLGFYDKNLVTHSIRHLKNTQEYSKLNNAEINSNDC